MLEVVVWSGEGMLPSTTALSGSLDGEQFTLLSSRASFGEKQVSELAIAVSQSII